MKILIKTLENHKQFSFILFYLSVNINYFLMFLEKSSQNVEKFKSFVIQRKSKFNSGHWSSFNSS